MTTDKCLSCEQSGGKCAYSENKKYLGCLCSNSKASYPDCRPSKSPTLHILLHSLRFCDHQTTHSRLRGCISNFHLLASLRVPCLRCVRVPLELVVKIGPDLSEIIWARQEN
jgi:hypothetical protein